MKGMKIEEINIMKEILEIINQEKKVMIALVIALIVEEISILEKIYENCFVFDEIAKKEVEKYAYGTIFLYIVFSL